MDTQRPSHHVYFLSGYDPRGARHYYGLFAKQMAQRGKFGDINFSLGKREKTEHFANWQWNVAVTLPEENRPAHHKMIFLRWDDICRKYWIRSPWIALKLCIYTLYFFLFRGVLTDLLSHIKNRKIMILFPVLFFILEICLSGLLYLFFVQFITFNPYLHGVLFFAFFLLFHLLFYSLARKLAYYWVVQLVVSSYRWAIGKIPELDNRLISHAQAIYEDMKTHPEKEFTLLSHSVGCLLANVVLAHIISLANDDNQQDLLQRLNFITLGNYTLYASVCKVAYEFRKRLALLANQKEVVWVDFSSPKDAPCVPLANPLLFTNPGQSPKMKTKFLSPRFHLIFAPSFYHTLKYNWYEMHFLYLRCPDILAEYDLYNLLFGLVSTRQKLEKLIDA